MKHFIVAGSHGCGKSSLLAHALTELKREGARVGVFKVDPRPSYEVEFFARHGIAAYLHASGDVCPDHEAMVALATASRWASKNKLDILAIETGGLCHRCSPFLRRFLAVCVVSGLSNIWTPQKMRALITQADVIVLTRAEMLSPAEREILLERIRRENNAAKIFSVNGLTGEGVLDLVNVIKTQKESRFLDIEPLRSTLPTGYCHFCQGIGSGHE